MGASGNQTVFIDGYNVIMRHVPWRRLPLREGRRHLEELAARLRWPVPAARVVVVFDGREAGPGLVAPRAGVVQVCFASPSADAYIQQAIRTSPHPERLLVISDDREILRTAKHHGVRCQAGRWLLERGLPSRSAAPSGDRPALPAAAARRITDELSRRWLGKDASAI